MAAGRTSPARSGLAAGSSAASSVAASQRCRSASCERWRAALDARLDGVRALAWRRPAATARRTPRRDARGSRRGSSASTEVGSIEPEVSFSIYGERGIIDILAWHPSRRMLLVIELKTEIVEVNEMLGTLDRRRRLAIDIARQAGLGPDRGQHLGRHRGQPNEPPGRRRARRRSCGAKIPCRRSRVSNALAARPDSSGSTRSSFLPMIGHVP